MPTFANHRSANPPMHRTHNRARPCPGPLSAGLLLLLFLAVTGCQPIGYVANAVAGGDETVDVKAQFLGLQGKTIAVLVTMDEHTLMEFRDADRRLCQSISQELKTNLPPGTAVLSPAQMVKFVKDHPRLAAMPYGQLLKELKADRLLLVDIFEYHTHDPGNPHQWQGVCSAGISVASADAPNPDDLVYSAQVHVEYPKDSEIGMVNSDSATIEAALLQGFGLQVSWLFHDHKEPVVK